MSPRRTDVSEETARTWTELSRQGWPYARIGREVGVDRRTVARIVKQRWGKHVGEAAAQARGEVASRMLQEHFGDMETVAATVLRAIVPPSLRESLFIEVADVEALLQERLVDWLLRMKHMYLPGMGPD
ncbi:MAG: helix-turn-helix domain-containing protein, partial [Chloroflexota bacterium]|nr:helix-turn-helix domain-containing protein [Chloroflexota bacterium]